MSKEEARERLLQALPHLRFALKEAAKQGQPMVGILAVKPDNSGQILARFEASDFFNDLALVLDAPAQTEEDDLDCKATKIAQAVERGTLPDSLLTNPK